MVCVTLGLRDIACLPRIHPFQYVQLQWPGFFFRGVVHGTNAFEELPDGGALGGVCKTLVYVPARQRCQSVAQCAPRKGRCVICQVTRNGITACRQQAFPLFLKVPYSRGVAQQRVFALCCLEVLVNASHRYMIPPGTIFSLSANDKVLGKAWEFSDCIIVND